MSALPVAKPSSHGLGPWLVSMALRAKALPEGTFGKAYSNFMEGHNFSPDSRSPVHFVEDRELAYVMRRWVCPRGRVGDVSVVCNERVCLVVASRRDQSGIHSGHGVTQKMQGRRQDVTPFRQAAVDGRFVAVWSAHAICP